MDGNNKLSNDHIVSSTLTFNLDDPEGERRLRECLDAPNVSGCVREFEEWLRRVIDYGESASLEDVRDEFFAIFNRRGLSPWED